LDFQIISRDKFLKNFTTLFKRCDLNNDGVLNEEEFYQLLTHLSSLFGDLVENKTRYLHILDPFNHGNITFTDTVSLFSNV